MNGVGERTGNANLVTITANLQVKLGHEVLPPASLERLTATAHYVDELLNLVPNPSQPYVGATRSRTRAACTSPASGRTRRRSSTSTRPSWATAARWSSPSSPVAARSLEKAQEAGLTVDGPTAERVLERLKALEHGGYQFEAADGSFELLIRKESGDYEPLFRLESWRVIVEQRADGKVDTEATVKVWLEGERYVRTAEGNGPVNALDAALRSAIVEIHPHLRDIELVNYKVRILDEAKGTGAITRVLIDASDGEQVWGSIGVGENVIAASWQALVDSLEQPMQPGRAEAAAAARRA